MKSTVIRILIVEDDNDINDLIRDGFMRENKGTNGSDRILEAAGMVECVQTFSGTEALAAAENTEFDLIITDLMLPGLDGSELIAEIKKRRAKQDKCDIPVIVLSALTKLDTKVKMLSIGAEDYMTKPFEMRELIARAAVQLRRYSNKPEVSECFSWHGVVLNRSDHVVTVSADVSMPPVTISLTKIEFRILELLMSHPTKVFSKQDIYDRAWGDLYIGEDKTINVHIGNIRRKLKAAAGKEYIETVWGVGFRMARD